MYSFLISQTCQFLGIPVSFVTVIALDQCADLINGSHLMNGN